MRTSVFTIFTLGLAGLTWAPNVSLAKELPESPYAIFGDSSKTLDPKRIVKKGLLRCPIKLSNNTECFADFDFEKGFVVIRNRNGVTISSDSIGYTRKAMVSHLISHQTTKGLYLVQKSEMMISLANLYLAVAQNSQCCLATILIQRLSWKTTLQRSAKTW